MAGTPLMLCRLSRVAQRREHEGGERAESKGSQVGRHHGVRRYKYFVRCTINYERGGGGADELLQLRITAVVARLRDTKLEQQDGRPWHRRHLMTCCDASSCWCRSSRSSGGLLVCRSILLELGPRAGVARRARLVFA